MKKHNKSILAITLTLSLLNLSSLVQGKDEENTKRIWGKDRYETCAEIIKEGWQSSENAILVNGENFPDSLSASVLAKKYNAPVVLTKNSVLEGHAKKELERLQVKKVYIVGGESVVKPKIEKDLEKLGIQRERISGKDRYETSLALAKMIGLENGVILTTGLDYSDALSISPIAGKLQMPIILVPKDSLPDSILKFIEGKNIPKTYVIGAKDIISEEVSKHFPNVERIEGQDKFDRNINIIKHFEEVLDSKDFILASSEGFADALSGSAYAAYKGSPILLIGRNPAAVTNGYIKNKDLEKFIVLGGEGSISKENVDKIKKEKKPKEDKNKEEKTKEPKEKTKIKEEKEDKKINLIEDKLKQKPNK